MDGAMSKPRTLTLTLTLPGHGTAGAGLLECVVTDNCGNLPLISAISRSGLNRKASGCEHF
jgi:hypothetical protein